jgi:hypothetical protein
MNIEEIKERFRLTSEEANRMQEYMKKAENAEVLYCDPHDREFFDFEECPGCKEDRADIIAEIQNRAQVGMNVEEILKNISQMEEEPQAEKQTDEDSEDFVESEGDD